MRVTQRRLPRGGITVLVETTIDCDGTDNRPGSSNYRGVSAGALWREIADGLAASYGFGVVFVILWKILQWPVVLAFLLLGFALIYYWAPDLRDQNWRWVTPGSVAAVLLWLLVSFGFRLYRHFFDSYSKTYGSLGAVIVLMLWFYLTGAAILIGGEINSDIEDLAARKGAPQAKKKGEKQP